MQGPTALVIYAYSRDGHACYQVICETANLQPCKGLKKKSRPVGMCFHFHIRACLVHEK
jgi:hypothetical protein